MAAAEVEHSFAVEFEDVAAVLNGGITAFACLIGLQGGVGEEVACQFAAVFGDVADQFGKQGMAFAVFSPAQRLAFVAGFHTFAADDFQIVGVVADQLDDVLFGQTVNQIADLFFAVVGFAFAALT